jgi:hypothetical protein
MLMHRQISESKHLKLLNTKVNDRTIDLTVKKIIPHHPKTPNLHKLQSLIKLLNLTKVNEYSLGKEHNPLCIHWEICIFVKGIAISIPQRSIAKVSYLYRQKNLLP